MVMDMSKIRFIVFVTSLCMGLSGCGNMKDTELLPEISLQSADNDTIADESEIKDDYSSGEIPSQAEIVEEHGFGNEINRTKAFLAAEAGTTEDKIQLFDIDDYDGDGEYEAFALIGNKSEYDLYGDELVEGSVWFVNRDGAKLLCEQKAMGFEGNSKKLEFGKRKYAVFSDVATTMTLSYAYEVKGKEVLEVPFSKCGTIVRNSNSNFFRIVDSSYDTIFDPEINDTLGHTWKSYYFYYDRSLDSVKEFGGVEITKEEAEDLAGRDLVTECLDPKDNLEKIIYRQNGIIHINYSTPEKDGCISYYHRTWDNEGMCFINDNAEKSDEAQAGVYGLALCPEIAEYPRLE